MPTGMKPYRTRFIPTGGSWTHPQASPATQTFHIPIYQLRNTPDRWLRNYCNSWLIYSSAAGRQRMANNGYEVEVGGQTSAGKLWGSQRPYRYIWGYAGATGGGKTALDGGNNLDQDYTRWCGAALHEYNFAEIEIFFPAGQRPLGKEAYNSIFDWPEVQTLKNDCNANGFPDTGAGFTTQMRISQRIESKATTTTPIPYNATADQVRTAIESLPYVQPGDVSTSGGPLPGAPVDVSFAGQYTNRDMVQMIIFSSTLSAGTAGVTTTVAGTQEWPAPYNITAQSETQRISITGSPPTSGAFVVGFYGGVDRMIQTAGPGGTGGTPQSRVDRWVKITTDNGWFL